MLKNCLRACALALIALAAPASAIYSDVQPLCLSSIVTAFAPADTNENILVQCTIPARALVSNALLRITVIWNTTNNANVKTGRVRYSGIAGTVFTSPPLASGAGAITVVVIGQRGVPTSQVGYSFTLNAFTGILATIATNVTSAVDTTQPTFLTVTCQKATGTDVCTVEGFLVELIGGGT